MIVPWAKRTSPSSSDLPGQRRGRVDSTHLALAVIMLLAAFVRSQNLGALGLTGDEDITALAIQGILDHGIPRLPSGMIYLRSLPTLYLQAGLVALLGWSEAVLRVPSVVFSVGTIGLGYLLGRKLFGRGIGLGVALFLAMSPWETVIARSARMYASFGFFYLLTVVVFHSQYVQGSGRWKILAPLLAVFTCTVHMLGFSLAPLFLLPLLFEATRRVVSRWRLLSAFAFVAGFFVLWRSVLVRGFTAAITRHPIPPGVEMPAAELGVTHPGPDSEGDRLLLLLRELDLPQLDFLRSAYHQHHGILFAAVSLVALVAIAWVIGWWRRGRPLEKVLLVLVIVSAYLHQIAIAGLLIGAYALLAKRGLGVLRSPALLVALLITVAGAALWLGFGLTMWEGNDAVLSGKSTYFRQTVKALVDFPRQFLLSVLAVFPALTVACGLGSLWCFDQGARRHADPRHLFILGCLFVPLGTQGLAESEFHLRYNYHLHTFLLILAWIGVVHGGSLAAGGLSRLAGRAGGGVARLSRPIVIALLAAVALVDLNPVPTLCMVQANPVVATGPGSGWYKLVGHEYSDQRGAAAFVKERLQPGDVVVAMDWLTQRAYLGRTDYWLRSREYGFQVYWEEGLLKDAYTGAILVRDAVELTKVLADHARDRVWIISCRDAVDKRDTVSEEIVDAVHALSEHVVFHGGDGRSCVYLLDGRNPPPDAPVDLTGYQRDS